MAADPGTLLALAAAAAVAGAMNSVAGGGTFLTFPALLVAGVPPIVANATSSVALWPGSLASAGGYREELRAERRLLPLFAAASAVGGLLGAVLLLLTPPPTFAALVPALLLGATLIFALGPHLTARLRIGSPEKASGRQLAAIALFQVGIAIYGGYFGAGIGILMLAALSLLGMKHIHRMNGLKVVLAAIINGVANATFVLAGIVDWGFALPMVVGAIVGGYGGARVARRIEPRYVRWFVIAVGLGLSAWFALRGA